MANNAILAVLTSHSRSRLADAGSAVSLETGMFLCRQGDPGDAIFVVLEGEIEVTAGSVHGREVHITCFGPSALIGEMAALDGAPRSADMVAVRRTKLWRIPRAPLLEALKAEPGAAVALIAELASRLRAANRSLSAMRTLDLGGRLAQLLLNAMGERALVPWTQTEIARRLGASREKVNRKLHAWVGRGWVELTASGIRVIDRKVLAAMTE